MYLSFVSLTINSLSPNSWSVVKCKQFVANQVQKIREPSDVVWRHVPTQDNPSDLASQGGQVAEVNQLQWKGPEWLSDPAKWPADLVTTHR